MATKETDKTKNLAPKADLGADAKGFSAKPQPSLEQVTELTDTIAHLEATIAQATTKEQQLAQTIVDLQAKVTHQISTIQDLQADLQDKTQQSQQLQAALEKAEAAARQLAAMNESLIAENTTLKAQKKSEPAAEPKSQSSSLAPRSTRPGSNLMHPVFPNGTLPSGIADQEIGWFD